MNETWTKWCDRVCGQIRFWPDHKAVRQELEGHMEDRCQAFLADGLTGQEAEDCALAAMGDAVEVGQKLDRVHKPLLGWLWLASRWAVCLLLAAALVLGIRSVWRNCSFYGMWAGMLEINGFTEELRQSSRAFSDGYQFILRASATQPEDAEAGTMCVVLKMEIRDWLLSGTCLGINAFYGVDDLGNYYLSQMDSSEEDSRRIVMGTQSDWYGNKACAVFLYGVPEDAQWLELRYDDYGRDIVLHAGLTGGKSA